MSNILDPPIAIKIRKMRERVLWKHPFMQQQTIDQTRLVIDDPRSEQPDFSFLVIGDSGSGPHPEHHPQRRIAEQMLPHLPDCNFLLHTGDVVYQVGAREQYFTNFIEPYREFLVGGETPDRIAYDRMVFRTPFLPVMGNHDYYNLPILYSLAIQGMRSLHRWFGRPFYLNQGWRGSHSGDIYARAFLDYLKGIDLAGHLPQHLEQHYRSDTETGRCLTYQPGIFTRLPNRYYTFRYGGIDFFALDSSTFNAPSPLPHNRLGDRYRETLDQEYKLLQSQEQDIQDEAAALDPSQSAEAERLDDLQAKLEQIAEMKLDIEKQITAESTADVDVEQLTWLKQRLIQSWQNPSVRGRILYFHHPPYVTEITKWHQGQTLAVRHHLRWVLDGVADALGDLPNGRSIVDLVLNGHAHCFEYLRSMETGHADAHLNWIVCGGSGLSLRRQRPEGPELFEDFAAIAPSQPRQNHLVAKSQLFVGLTGHKSERHRPYSFLRIDVKPGSPPQFIVRPFVSERYQQTWSDRALEPLVL